MNILYEPGRHRGSGNACYVDGHVERVMPRKIYCDNTYWNGQGCEDPERDPHVPYRFLVGEFHYVLDEQ